MISPRIRASMSTEDFRALEDAISRLDDKDVLKTLANEGPDRALAHPACDLGEIWTGGPITGVRVEIFMYAIVRHMISTTPIENNGDAPAVSDYVATVLVEFASGKRAWSADAFGEHPAETLASACAAAEKGVRGARQHAGNMALWLGGLFPDRVAHLRERMGGPGMSYYDEIGQMSFRLAAAETSGISDIMNLLADEFVPARRGLNTLADAVLFKDWRQGKLERMIEGLS